MCIEVWRRPPCGHSVYQNTFHCDHANNNEDGAVFSDDVIAPAAGRPTPTHNYEDELYHAKPSPTELRRRRLSSLSLLSGSSPSAGASIKSPCRLTRAVRPVQERECAECEGLWRESQWRHHHQSSMGHNGWYTPGHDAYIEDDGAAATGHDGFMHTGEGRLRSMSPGSSPGGSPQHWAPRPESSRRHRNDARRQSGAAARRLENAFFMIAQRQVD